MFAKTKYLVVTLLLLFLATTAFATALPDVNNISPSGVQISDSSPVTIRYIVTDNDTNYYVKCSAAFSTDNNISTTTDQWVIFTDVNVATAASNACDTNDLGAASGSNCVHNWVVPNKANQEGFIVMSCSDATGTSYGSASLTTQIIQNMETVNNGFTGMLYLAILAAIALAVLVAIAPDPQYRAIFILLLIGIIALVLVTMLSAFA
jgi:hypothetical protein